MRFFLRSRQFKIILSIFCAVVLLTASFAIIGRRMSPQTDIASTIAAPFRNLFTNVTHIVTDFFDNYNGGSRLSLENSELKAEIDTLRQQIADYQEIAEENDFYKSLASDSETSASVRCTAVNAMRCDRENRSFLEALSEEKIPATLATEIKYTFAFWKRQEEEEKKKQAENK